MEPGQSTYELFRSVRDAGQIFKLPPWGVIPAIEKTAWAAVERGGVSVQVVPPPAVVTVPVPASLTASVIP